MANILAEGYYHQKGLECGSAVEQEAARRRTTPATTSLPANMTNWKMVKTKRLLSFSGFSVKVMKQVGWRRKALAISHLL